MCLGFDTLSSREVRGGFRWGHIPSHHLGSALNPTPPLPMKTKMNGHYSQNHTQEHPLQVYKVSTTVIWEWVWIHFWLGLHDILHAIVLRISSVKTVLWLAVCVLNAAPFENSWWRFTANHRTVFTDEMRMTIACKISCSPTSDCALFLINLIIVDNHINLRWYHINNSPY